MKTESKLFLGISVLTILLVVGSVWFMSKKLNPSVKLAVVEEEILVREDSPKRGKSAPVTLVEFSDFECPACGASAPAVKELLSLYPDQIQLVYRHFPLDNIHKNARLAAYASEAAANQDRFWEMHDIIFAKQSEWSVADDVESVFVSYAQALELDVNLFKDDLNSVDVKSRVDRGVSDGNLVKVQATPTFFINGQQTSGLGSADFNELLEAALLDNKVIQEQNESSDSADVGAEQ